MEISQIVDCIETIFPPVLLLHFYGADRNYRQTSNFNSHVFFYLRALNILTLPTVSRWSAFRIYRPFMFILQVLCTCNI